MCTILGGEKWVGGLRRRGYRKVRGRKGGELVLMKAFCAFGILMSTYLKLNVITTLCYMRNVLKEKPVCRECVTESHDSLSYGIHRG